MKKVTYVNSRDIPDRSSMEQKFPFMKDHELIFLEFPMSVVSWKDNSLATQDWLKRIGREDLVRPLNDPPKED